MDNRQSTAQSIIRCAKSLTAPMEPSDLVDLLNELRSYIDDLDPRLSHVSDTYFTLQELVQQDLMPVLNDIMETVLDERGITHKISAGESNAITQKVRKELEENSRRDLLKQLPRIRSEVESQERDKIRDELRHEIRSELKSEMEEMFRRKLSEM